MNSMNHNKNEYFIGVVLIITGILASGLYIDGFYFRSYLFSVFSTVFSNSMENLFGLFPIMIFTSFLVVGVLFIINYDFRSKLFVSLGYIALVLFIPPFFYRISQDNYNSGYYGRKLSEILAAGGFAIEFLVYFLWFSLAVFLLLFPVREKVVYLLAKLFQFSPNLISKTSTKKDSFVKHPSESSVSDFSLHKTEKSKTIHFRKKEKLTASPKGDYAGEDSNVSSEYNRKRKERNQRRLNRRKRESVPWLSKVIYESYDKRLEVPMFQSGNIPIKKFRLKRQEENIEEYQEVDTLSTTLDTQSSSIKEEADQKKEEYFERVKENWPEPWKNGELVPKDVKEIALDEEIERVEISIGDDLHTEDFLESKEEAEELLGEEPDDCTYPDVLSYSEQDNFSPIANKISSEESFFSGEETAEWKNSDTIDGDDIKKFMNENLNLYAQSKSRNSSVASAFQSEDILEDENWEVRTERGWGSGKEERNPLPDMEILEDSSAPMDREEYHRIETEDAKILESTLFEFGIKAEVCDIIHGPVVTLFKIVPAAGIKLSRIEGLSDNLALRLAAQSIRIIAPIPGEKVVGIEVPNKRRELVSFKEVVNSDSFTDNHFHIPVGVGKDIYGKVVVIDLHKMPHVLIAGATGAGKSVCVNVFLSSILFSRSPDDVRLVLIDPKIVELQPYDGIPHLLTPVITDPKEAVNALKYLVYEMEERYALLGKIGVRDISEYRKMVKEGKLNFTNMPFIVAFVDEFADLMSTSGKEAEMLFARLTAKARAVGIHLILATQRPSTDVITGLIKSNVPARIAFQVISYQDSRIILDQKGAEKLLGQGDMLYLSPTQPFPIRLQGAYLNKEEVDLIAEHWKRIGEPEYVDIEEILGLNQEEDSLFDEEKSRDPLFEEAVEIVIQTKKASASYLQRRLNIGYNRAARMVEEMEERGIVGPMQGSKPREIIGNGEYGF